LSVHGEVFCSLKIEQDALEPMVVVGHMAKAFGQPRALDAVFSRGQEQFAFSALDRVSDEVMEAGRYFRIGQTHFRWVGLLMLHRRETNSRGISVKF